MKGKGDVFESRLFNVLDPEATEISEPHLSLLDLPLHVFSRPDFGKRLIEKLYGVDVLR